MKKILFFLISMMLFSNITLAQESNLDINQILQTTAMPSDAEIMQMLETLNIPQAEKEFLFNETKKKLEQIYSTKDASGIIDAYQNSLNSQNILNDFQPNLEETPKRVKKYTNHPPLTRRRK